MTGLSVVVIATNHYYRLSGGYFNSVFSRFMVCQWLLFLQRLATIGYLMVIMQGFSQVAS